MWEALIQGLTTAQELAGGIPITVTVMTNYDLLVKQGRGEWKVKNPAQQPRAAQLSALREALGEVRFAFIKTDSMQRLFDNMA